jgi:hypothetical protein
MSVAYRFQNAGRKLRRKSKLKSLAPLLATGLGFVAFALCVPSNPSQKSEARIFTQGLSIEIDRSSPAYAALEDSLMEDTQTSDDSFNGSANDQGLKVKVLAQTSLAKQKSRLTTSTLVSGTTSAIPMAERLERETKREEALYAQERAAKEQAAAAILQSLTRPEAKIEVASNAATLAKQAPQAPIEHKTVTLTLADLGVKSREELAKQFSGPIVMAAREMNPNRVRIAANERQSQRQPDRQPTRTIANNDSVQSFASEPQSENQNENVRQIVINGNLEFTGGIALTSANDRVVVYREDEGEKFEPGAVWLREARYEIFVDRPVGRLVAELRSVSGELLGRGYYELDQLPKIEATKYRTSGVALRLGPVPHGISGRVMNGTVAGSKSFPAANANVSFEQLPYNAVVQKDGKFDEQTLLEGSSIVTRTTRQGSWGTLAFGHAGKQIDVSLFTDQAMRALIKSAAPADMNAERSSAYIWGRVTRGGSPVAGAKVDLMTTEKELKPVYFNKLGMPDPSLLTTTANGLYAFFPVTPGSHAIQAADHHGITEPNLFPADERTVTQVDLELKVTQQAKMRVFDAFKTDFPLNSEVISAGRTRGVTVPRTGEAKVTFTGGSGLLILDADSGSNYQRARVSVARDSRVIDFPMIQTSWIEGLRGSQRITPEAATGTIVGFVRGASLYRVALDEKSVGSASRIVYFDAKGDVARNQYGEAGGGFVIFNVPTGFRTVLIQPSGTTKALGSAVLVDSQVTNVISKSLQ